MHLNVIGVRIVIDMIVLFKLLVVFALVSDGSFLRNRDLKDAAEKTELTKTEAGYDT